VRRGNWEEALPRFSLDRRITVFVIMATALVVGAVATIGIPLELIPSGFDSPRIVVRANWRDAPAEEVLEKVVLPLEEELSTVRGLEQLNSWSTTGRGRVFLTFKANTDMDVAYREVRDRVLRARPRMPDDMEPIRFEKHSGANLPIMVLGVAIDPSVTDSYNLIQHEIIMPLERVDGVASVQSDGLEEKEVLIELDREKTAAAGLNIYLIARELAGDNFALASGTVKLGEQKLLLRSLARYRSLDEIRHQLISPTVRLQDIADVRYAVPEMFWRVRVNSKPALAVLVFKEGQANTIEVGERLHAAFDEIKKNPKLQGSELGVLFEQSEVIKESLWTLLDSGRVGAIFAALVLLLFLRRFRLTLIITLAIPLSMVIALIAMYFSGETLNILSLLGLIISVGLLVDNSVVVAENIVRWHREGVSRREACIKGAGEIALAIILATLTTIIVFLPVALVEGRGQFFLLRLAMPLTVSLAASLFVALIFIPLCVYLTLPRAHGKNGVWAPVRYTHVVADWVLGGIYRFTLAPLGRGYQHALGFFLRRRFDLVLILFVAFAVTMAGPAANLDIVDVSQEDRQDFQVEVELPSNYSLDDAEAFFGTVEKELEVIKKDLKLEGYFIFFTSRFGEVQGWASDEGSMNRNEMTKVVMDRLPKRPGIKYYSGEEDKSEQEKKKSVHTVVINGEDIATLDEVARNLEETLVQVDGVVGIKRSQDFTPNELALVVDRTRTQRQKINPQVVAGAVAVSLRGQPLPRYHENGKVIPVRVRFEEKDRQSLGELLDFSIPTTAGDLVQLSSVTDVRYLAAARGIFREGKRISRRIALDLEKGKEEATRKRIDALLRTIDLPEGVRFGASSAGNRFDEEVSAMKFAAVVSVLFIYLLMGFLFESFVLPLSIILTIPLASLGVLWTHYFAGRDLDFLGFIGVILLIGVVVNNGIVFVDYVNRLRVAGHERTEAVLLAAKRRYRPIMMTAGTTICGMIPLTLGAPTSIGLSYRSFGLALIGGMATASALTLLVVPVFYTLLDDARTFLLRTFGAAIRGGASRRSRASRIPDRHQEDPNG